MASDPISVESSAEVPRPSQAWGPSPGSQPNKNEPPGISPTAPMEPAEVTPRGEAANAAKISTLEELLRTQQEMMNRQSEQMNRQSEQLKFLTEQLKSRSRSPERKRLFDEQPRGRPLPAVPVFPANTDESSETPISHEGVRRGSRKQGARRKLAEW